MPRKPNTIRDSRKIREILGHTQTQMADMLGLSRFTLVKIENGQMKMPRNLAYKYQVITGCNLRPGLKDEGPLEVVYDDGQKTYCLADFDHNQMTREAPGIRKGLQERALKELNNITQDESTQRIINAEIIAALKCIRDAHQI